MFGRIMSVVFTLAVFVCTSRLPAQLVITSVFDGPLPNGLPKGVELFVTYDVPDLSQMSLGVAEDGSGAAGREFTFSEVPAKEGDFLYVASEAAQFESFFGFAPHFTTDVLAIDGNDADQDHDFDQLDLVMVQVAGKYLTGHPATWGEGDWDGAPGGSRGNPPPGNGLFDQVDIIAALSSGRYLTACYAALAPGGLREDDRTSLVYDANTGEVSIDAPRDRLLSWIALSSSRQIFDHAPGINLEGRMDSDTDGYIFKKVFDGAFGSLSLGNIARPGLSERDVLRDLSAIVSLDGENDDFNGIDLIYIAPVPEPATLLLLMVGLGCFGFCKNKAADS